jgi:hypothetical protein
VYDDTNDTVESNEILPRLEYPKGHKPELVRDRPLTKGLEILNPFAGPVNEDE